MGRKKGRAAARQSEMESESRRGRSGEGRVVNTLDSSPHRDADLNGGLAPGARHKRPHPL